MTIRKHRYSGPICLILMQLPRVRCLHLLFDTIKGIIWHLPQRGLCLNLKLPRTCPPLQHCYSRLPKMTMGVFQLSIHPYLHLDRCLLRERKGKAGRPWWSLQVQSTKITSNFL
ncbi:hypothetical protein FFLO_03490 [Filobasidium floriforme]|uniref:Uncharacterized protein n=1 Tax=Filobasidium floriforme TaxID=5210 RepID=A0A8K0JKN4_9TREE|nr:hypothetical protein FFLO_03490 [Filobasidium floriforme]